MSFTDNFVASIHRRHMDGGGADGLAFVLQNSAPGASAFGGGDGGLAYLGISPGVEVKFKIYAPNNPRKASLEKLLNECGGIAPFRPAGELLLGPSLPQRH